MKAGWENKKLGDVCDFEGGSQPPKSEFIFQEKQGYVRFLQIRDFGSDKHITFIPESKKNRLCKESDILIGRYGASVGKILTNKAGAYNVALMKTIPNLDVLDRSWFFHYLTSNEFQGRLLNVADRSAQNGFSKDDIYDFPVPAPPLPEQQRIVGILDEAFDGIATAKANAERNLQNARALFESYLQSVFTQRGEGWEEKRLQDVCEFSQGVQVDVKLQSELKKNNTQIRFLRIVDFTQGNEPERYIDNPGSKFLVSTSDVSLVRYGASTGFVCRGLDGVIANNLFRVIPKNNSISNEFLYWFLKSPAFQGEIKKSMNGAAMPAISFGMINDIALPHPSQSIQKQIVSKLDAFDAETQRLESIYQQKLAALDELKKSLLHQAFTGQL